MSGDGDALELVFLGPPGAGKGTHAAWLARERGLLHLSTGEMLRAAVREGSELGARAKSFMERGELVPDELIIDMLFERFTRSGPGGGWILDGFPRTTAQADALDARLAERGGAIDAILAFDVDAATLVARLSARLTCEQCGAVFNEVSDPPATAGVCDRCGAALVKRPDDRASAVEERLRVYGESTAPLVAYYERGGRLLRIDARRAIAEIREEIDGLLAGLP